MFPMGLHRNWAPRRRASEKLRPLRPLPTILEGSMYNDDALSGLRSSCTVREDKVGNQLKRDPDLLSDMKAQLSAFMGLSTHDGDDDDGPLDKLGSGVFTSVHLQQQQEKELFFLRPDDNENFVEVDDETLRCLRGEEDNEKPDHNEVKGGAGLCDLFERLADFGY